MRFNRSEFLADLVWWEVKSIIRGYNASHRPSWEQARLIAYESAFCMGVPKGETKPTVEQWITFPWERKAAEPVDPATIAELQNEMEQNPWITQ